MVHPRQLNAMKLFLASILLAPISSGAMAGIAEKKAGRNYSHLWTNSPFTEPKQEQTKPVQDAFEHYALAGVAPIPGGYRVTLLDRRNPGARIVLPEHSGFTLISVQYSSQHPLDTTVRLSLDGKEGLVRFDQNLLKPAGNLNPENSPDSPSNGQPNGNGLRTLRPRTTNTPANGVRPH